MKFKLWLLLGIVLLGLAGGGAVAVTQIQDERQKRQSAEGALAETQSLLEEAVEAKEVALADADELLNDLEAAEDESEGLRDAELNLAETRRRVRELTAQIMACEEAVDLGNALAGSLRDYDKVYSDLATVAQRGYSRSGEASNINLAYVTVARDANSNTRAFYSAAARC